MSNRLKEVYQNLKLSIKNNDKDENVLIIDSLNTFIRVFSAIPVLNENGEHIGGIVGFLKSIGSNIRQFSSTRCILVFDGKGGSARRRKKYPGYKGNRKAKQSLNRFEDIEVAETEEVSLKRQWNILTKFLDLLPVTIVIIDNIEADDTISYIVNSYYENTDNKITIISTDRDFLQLVNEKVRVWSPTKKTLYTPELIKSELNIDNRNYLLYRALTGDSSDNIPGVNGAGLKTLLKLFPELITMPFSKENLYDKVNILLKEKNPKKLIKTLSESADQINLNYELMQLSEVNISGQAKQRIDDILNQPITTLNVNKFKYMLIRNKLEDSFKNIDGWLRDTFLKLNIYK